MPETTSSKTTSASLWQEPLGRSVKINFIIICILFILGMVIALAGYLSKIILLIGLTILATYVLLKPVDIIHNLMDRTIKPGNSSEKKERVSKRHRIISITLVYLLCGFLISGFSIQFFPKLSHQIQGFSNDLPRYYDKLETRVNAIMPSWLEVEEATQGNIDTVDANTETSRTALDQVAEWLKQYSSGIVKYLFNIGTNTITSLVYILTGIVMIFYFLLDGEKLREGTANMMPERFIQPVSKYLLTIHKVLYYFTQIQLVMGFAAGLYLYILLSIYQFKYALLLGVIYGFASVIPVIGSWFGLIPTFLVALFRQDPTVIIPITIFIGIFFMFKTYWLLPKGLNYRFGIHPVIIILTFLVCVQLVGPIGIFLVFPIASAIAGSYAYSQKKLEFSK